MIEEQFNDRERLNDNETTILSTINNGIVTTVNHKIDHAYRYRSNENKKL